MLTERIDNFMAILEVKLKEKLISNPESYSFTVESLPEILPQFRTALIMDEYCYGIGAAIRETCHELRIYPGYRSIHAYLMGEER